MLGEWEGQTGDSLGADQQASLTKTAKRCFNEDLYQKIKGEAIEEAILIQNL